MPNVSEQKMVVKFEHCSKTEEKSQFINSALFEPHAYMTYCYVNTVFYQNNCKKFGIMSRLVIPHVASTLVT